MKQLHIQKLTKKQLSQTPIMLTQAEVDVLRQKKKAMCDFAQKELSLRLNKAVTPIPN